MSEFKPRKSIVSRYSTTKVNTKFYGSVDLAKGSGTTSDDIQIGITTSNSGQGYVWMPYIPVSTGVNINGIFYPNKDYEKIKAAIKRKKREKKLKRIFQDKKFTTTKIIYKKK